MQSLTPIDNAKLTSFWERKEGLAGMIIVGCLAVGGLGLLWVLLPYIIIFLQNLIMAIGLLLGAVVAAGITAFVLAVLWRVRKLFKYAIMSVSRAITGIFVSVAPLAIMKDYKQEAEETIEDVDQKRTELMAQENRLIGKKKKYMAAIQTAMDRARHAKSDDELTVYTREVARQEQLLVQANELLEVCQTLGARIKKARQAAVLYIQDVQGEINKREEEQDTIRPAHSAIKAIASLFSGNSEGHELYTMADDMLIRDYEEKMASIRLYSENIQGVIDQTDADQAILSERGREMLRQLEEQEKSILDPTRKSLNPAPAKVELLTGAPTVREKQATPVNRTGGSKYF